MSPEFLFTAFIVCLVPGIGVVYTLSSTLGQGFRAGFWASVGCTIATLVHLGVALAGLAAVLHTSALLFQTIKYAGVAYLLYMAWGTLKGTGGLALEAAAPQSTLTLIWRGVLLNLLNPKLPLFFVAFLPQFMAANDGPVAMAELGVVFAVLTFLTFLGYTALAASGRQAILSRPAVMAWMRRAFAASFAALGVRLAFERA